MPRIGRSGARSPGLLVPLWKAKMCCTGLPLEHPRASKLCHRLTGIESSRRTVARKAAAAGAQRESGPDGGGRGRSAWTAGDLEARRTAGEIGRAHV